MFLRGEARSPFPGGRGIRFPRSHALCGNEDLTLCVADELRAASFTPLYPSGSLFGFHKLGTKIA